MTGLTRVREPLDDVLAGSSGADGVRRVVTDPLAHGAAECLEAAVRRWSDGPGNRPLQWSRDDLVLVRSKLKPARKLSADYVLRPGPDVGQRHHVAISWTVQQGAVTASVSLSPEDPRMPQLERLTRPEHVAALAASLTGRPADPAGHARVRTIRYRPGQRHVLLADLGRAFGSVYVKTDRDRSGAAAVRTAAVVGRALDQHGTGACTAEPLGWAERDSAALWWQAPGTPLSLLLSRRSAERVTAVRRAGAAVAALHRLPRQAAGTAAPTSYRDAEDESHAVLGAGDHVRALLPGVGATYDAHVHEVVRRLRRLPVEEPVICHGDYKCDNILVHRGNPRILDLDRMCMAEPALDLGKLLADLGWWCADAAEQESLTAAFRAGYDACDSLRWARAELWAVLFSLKIAARRCAVHDPCWEAGVRDRVDAAARALARAGGR